MRSPWKPRAITPVDVVAMAWRERWTGLIVGASVLALGAVVAVSQPKTYRAESRILVRLGQEYVFQPTVGGAGAGNAPRSEEMINAELKLLQSPEIARRVVERVGLAKLYPKLAGGKANAALREAQAEAAFERNFHAWTSPNTPIIQVTFGHPNADLAAKALNATVEEYLAYRSAVLVAPVAGELEAQSRAFDQRSAEAASAVDQFLAEHGIADFDSDQKALTDLNARIEMDLAEAQAKRHESQGRADMLKVRAAQEPAVIDQQVESDAAKHLIDLKVEREQLLGRYKPDAAPVQDIERRIAQVEAYVDTEQRPGVTRKGPNPVRQSLETELYNAQAEARAQAARESALSAQRDAVAQRLADLRALEPQYRTLERDRQVLSDNARSFVARAEEARAVRALSGAETDAIRQIEPARPPLKGQSLRMQAAILSAFLALVLGVAAAIARGLARSAFPTASSAARGLGPDVLGVMVRTKAGRAA